MKIESEKCGYCKINLRRSVNGGIRQMSSGTGRGASEKTARVASVVRALAFVVIAVSTIIATPRQTQALPSFARQTGQACGACHTDYPQLTPFGRRFKLGGYTLGGGRSAPEYKKTFGDDSWMPPISVMGIGTFTNTQAGQPGGMSRFLLNIAKRSLPRLMLSGVGMANKVAM